VAGRQVRAVPGALIGFDMPAVLAMASPLGVTEGLVIEFMPALETELIKAHNRDTEDNGREAGISPDQG
jgi:hypothetical protein